MAAESSRPVRNRGGAKDGKSRGGETHLNEWCHVASNQVGDILKKEKKSRGICRDTRRNPVLVGGADRERGRGSSASQSPGCRDVLPTQEIIDHLAHRIERAYALRRAGWDGGCSSGRIWSAAAQCLWQAHVEDPTLPLDSELFVASQPIVGTLGDPWGELTQVEAGRRYRAQVRRIVRRLRRELRREVGRAERILGGGGRMVVSTLGLDGRVSPLGCYIAAERMGRIDIAAHFTAAAVEQHHACPLYQSAALALLPADRYPVVVAGTGAPPPPSRSFKKSIMMN